MSKSVAETALPATVVAASEVFARDSMLAWYRGEFAAANAIIDALCSHVVEIGGGGLEYEAAFAAIHRRRMNWIPVIQMQRFFSIADVTAELQRVAEKTKEARMSAKEMDHEERSSVRVSVEGDEEGTVDSSGDCSDHKIHPEICDGELAVCLENAMICSNHEECAARPEKIKTCKGFLAKEPVKGNMASSISSPFGTKISVLRCNRRCCRKLV